MRATLKKLAHFGFRMMAQLQSPFDKKFLAGDIPMSGAISHRDWRQHVYELGKGNGLRILEIGSREVTGPSDARRHFANSEYIGFDYYPGDNVDVVGDAHRLSTYFPSGEQFDLIYSSACFEHFAMPWLVAEQIARMLKVGGLLFVETHFSFAAHERPWNFFQFSDMGLRVLFSSALGFECIEAGMSNPIVGRFSALADEDLKYRPIRGLYCHSEYLGRKVREVTSFDWGNVDMAELVAGTTYRAPKP
jgi:SAM-dependent methyltransferase